MSLKVINGLASVASARENSGTWAWLPASSYSSFGFSIVWKGSSWPARSSESLRWCFSRCWSAFDLVHEGERR